jgi:hypothetical protein
VAGAVRGGGAGRGAVAAAGAMLAPCAWMAVSTNSRCASIVGDRACPRLPVRVPRIAMGSPRRSLTDRGAARPRGQARSRPAYPAAGR